MLIYIGATIFVAVFGLVYESFSFGVYSDAMLFAWVFPLTCGAVVCGLLYYIPIIKYVPGNVAFNTYNFGIGLLTGRSIFIGVIEIYGTTNELMLNLYTILSSLAIIGGVTLYFVGLFFKLKKNKII